jgi:TonB family protein
VTGTLLVTFSAAKNTSTFLGRPCDALPSETSNSHMYDAPSAIFEQSTVGRAGRPRRSLPASIALHLVIFLVLLRGRSPIFVAPSSALGGVHGTSVTHLYWARDSAHLPQVKSSDSTSKARAASKPHLVWKKATGAEVASNFAPPTLESKSGRDAETASSLSPSAGSPYGSLSDDASAGQEIRPALPAVTSEPQLGPEDLRGVAEGNVVIEITIDESGTIVNKAVVQSMGLAIDTRVLAALENWRFRPATRDGVPIPSKQDVVYHFKPRPS